MEIEGTKVYEGNNSMSVHYPDGRIEKFEYGRDRTVTLTESGRVIIKASLKGIVILPAEAKVVINY